MVHPTEGLLILNAHYTVTNAVKHSEVMAKHSDGCECKLNTPAVKV